MGARRMHPSSPLQETQSLATDQGKDDEDGAKAVIAFGLLFVASSSFTA